MEPFEIMISESQERMAAIVEPAAWPQVEAICRRWDIDATVIGEVTRTGDLRAFYAGELVGDIPAGVLTDGSRATCSTAPGPARLADDPVPPTDEPVLDPSGALRALLESPGGASRRWVTRQYDQLVGSGTVVPPGGDAAVVRLTPSRRAIAVALDGNGRRTWLDPRRGGDERGLRGGQERRLHRRPAGGCHQLPQLRQPRAPRDRLRAARRRSRAWPRPAEALGLPVVSGNVSLYNEHDGRPIQPTPVVGVVGVLEDAELAVRGGFRASGDVVLLAGAGHSAVDGSDYQKVVLGEVAGRIPEPDLDHERALHAFLAAAADRGLLQSAHDVGGGGLAVAVAQSAIAGGDRGRASRSRATSSARATAGSWCRPGASDVAALRRPRDRHPAAPAGHGRRRPRSRSARPGSRSPTASRRSRRRCPGSWTAPADVRRLRHLRTAGRARPRRRAADLLRPLRAPAPRSGERGHRRLRRRADHGDEGHGSGQPGVRRGQALGARGPHRDRARPLLDHRLDGVAERPAGRAPRRRPHDRARAQRQPDQHGRAARGAAGAARVDAVDVRHRGDRRADRPA